MRRLLILTVFALVGVAVTAPVASAAQTLTVTGQDEWGFETRAPEGWRVTDCYSAAGYDSTGAQVTAASWDPSYYGRGTRWAWFDFAQAPIETIARVSATCDLKKGTRRYRDEWRWRSNSKAGTATARRVHSQGCFFAGYAGTLKLDCWGGRYAAVRYSFNLPSDARRVQRSIRGSIGCCSNGRVIRTWRGTRAYVAVTGWRSFTVRRVTLNYQTKVRVPYTTWSYDTGTVG